LIPGAVSVYAKSFAYEPVHELVVRHAVQTRDRAQDRRLRVFDLAALQA
jgi:hypothetical protein